MARRIPDSREAAEKARLARENEAKEAEKAEAQDKVLLVERAIQKLKADSVWRGAVPATRLPILDPAAGFSTDGFHASVAGYAAWAEHLLPLYVAIPLGTPASMAEFVVRERSAGIRNFQAKLGPRLNLLKC